MFIRLFVLLTLFISFSQVSISNIIVPNKKSESKLSKLPLTQTEAYLSAALGGAFKSITLGKTKDEKRLIAKGNIENFLRTKSIFSYKSSDYLAADDAYLNSLIDMYLAEADNKGMYVFYHSTNVQMGWLYDIANEFRRQVGASAKKTAFQLRYEDHKFKDFQTVEDFYSHFDINDYNLLNYRIVQNKKYTDYGVSANVSLFGSDGVEGSSSFDLFYRTNTNQGMTRQDGLTNFSAHVGVQLPYAKYDALYQKYFWSRVGDPNPTISPGYNSQAFLNRGNFMNNRMIQIFVHPSVINSMAYAAVAGGAKVEFKKNPWDIKGDFHLRTPLFNFRKDPRTFTSSLPLTLGSINSLQARLYVSPQWSARPDLVKTKVYFRHPLKADKKVAYRKELADAIKSDLAAAQKPTVSSAKKKFVITKKLQRKVKKAVKAQKKAKKAKKKSKIVKA